MTDSRSAAGTAAGTGEGAHLLDYLRVLWKHAWLILGVFTVVVAAVGVFTWKATPLYRATATINIQPPNVFWGQLDPMVTAHTVNQSQKYMNTQYELLKQRSLIVEMVRERHLATEWARFRDLGMSEPEIVRSLAGRVSVSPDKDSFFVRVSVVYEDAEVAPRLANALVETFKQLQSEAASGALKFRMAALENTASQYRRRAEETNVAIEELMAQHDTDRETFVQGLASMRDRYAELLRQEDSTDAELAKTRPRYERIQAAVEKESAEGNDGLRELFGESFVVDAPFVLRERKAIEQMEDDLEALMQQENLGPENERVVEFRDRIGDRKQALDFDIRMLLRGYILEFEDRLVYREAVGKRKAVVEEVIRERSVVMRDVDRLTRRLAQVEAERERYHGVFEKLELNTENGVEPVTIVEEAGNAVHHKPDKRMNMTLAVIFGLLAGMGLAFFLEYMDDTVKSKEELQRVTDVPLFGVIPYISGSRGDVRKKDLYAYDQPKSTISEAFRGIRTAISYSSQRTENRVYLVTSSGPKEGKSTITINVATVMAYSGTKTVLVDADLRRPRVHKSFGLPNSRGLTNVIIGDVSVEEAVQPTEVENLYVLPSGPIPPNPSELLGRDRMVEVLEDLRRSFDRVMLDTPPLGAVTDAAVLGRIVDSVILVVHAGRTRKRLIERGLEQLSQIDVDVSGIVLNNLRIGRRRYAPGYYDYYYYSSYYGGEDDVRPRKKDGAGSG